MSYDVLTMSIDEVTERADELQPDIILMDVRLDGEKDGIEVAQQINSRYDIPIIFITANADEATVRRAITAEPDGILIKPLNALELTATIEMAMHRHGAGARARESDRRIREIAESLSEVIFETDMAGNITFVNRAGLKEFGYKREQVEVGITLYDLVPPDKHEEIRESIAQAVIDEPSEWIEVPGLRRDGSTFPISVRASLIVREGVPAGIRGIALNVTERKRAEQKLEESERRIRELTDALPEIIFEADANGIITFANAVAFTRHGYTKGELEGKMNLLDLVAHFDRERARETIRKRIQGEDRGWVEYDLIKKDGSTAPFDVRTMPIVRDGVYEGLRGIAIEISERKRAEAALLRSERRIRELTDALPEVVYETDATGVFSFVSASCLEMFGYTKEEFEAGMTVFDVIVADDRERGQETFHQRIDATELGWVEYTGLRKDGRAIPLSVSARPIHRDGVVIGVRGIAADNTQRKRSEEKLRESERRIRELTDALPVVVYETDAKGRMTFVNATAFDLFGYAKEEIEAGMSIFQLIAPADRKQARAVFRRRMSGEDVGRVEYVGLRKDKSSFPISIRAALMRHDGAVIGLRGVILDITELKKADLALHKAQEELRQHATMFDAAHDAIMTLDPAGTITYWNRGAERLYGWTTQEAEGQNANALLRTRFPESREVLWPKLMESELWEGELIHVTRDGVEVTVASSWTLMKDEKGNASAILEISSDITERKKADLALAESEATLRTTFATMADGIVITELDEKVTDCNEAILRLTQRSREEILGKPFKDLIAPEFRSVIADVCKLLVGSVLVFNVPGSEKKGTIRADSQLLRKNRERVDIETNISLVENSAGQPAAFLIVARDVTERKQMEWKLDSSLADLQRSNAELQQFAYVTSHDLQEPLRMITSYIQIIEEDYKGKLDADADQYIAFAVEGAKRMHTLINDLLAYSRVGTRGEPFTPISLNSVLSSATANLEIAIEEGHAVVTHDRLPTVLGDESQLIQLFQNLLGNAIKFRSDATPRIHVGVEKTKDEWVFSVRDNGIGIDMKYAERIFAVFQRLHAREEYPGTGIGLAVVKKIVERHGGRVWVESEPGNGSTFYFTLPKGE
jgi:PAS domain S-box-containing protein